MTDPVSTAVAAPRLALGAGAAAYEAAVERARTEEWASRLFTRDVSLWTTDPRVAETISERLGWLDAPEHFTEQIPGLEAFGDAVVDEGYTTAVVAGMGGSSLAPDILRRTFGSTEGYLELRILDSTDPAYVHEVLDDLDPLRTLVIIASKSGTTTEPNAFLAYAWARAEAALAAVPHHRYEHPGAYFAVITDPGKSDAIKNSNDFREIFLNPPDIGGRYSALTYVGLVPASLIGVDLDPLLAAGAVMLGACHEPDPALNPGLSLGIAIATLAKGGRDKLTFLIDDEIASLRGVGGAAARGEHGQAGRRHRPRRPRAARRGRGVRRRPDVRPDRAGGERSGRARHARGRPRGGRPPGHPDRAVGPDRPRRGGHPLGGRHGDRRDRARHRPVRPAQRRGGQAAHPRRARVSRPATNARPTSPGRSRAATGWRCTATRPSG